MKRITRSSNLTRRQAIGRGLVAAGGLVMAHDTAFRALADAAASAEQSSPPSEFPADLCRETPVQDLNDAVVFTMNEYIGSESALEASRCVGSDMFIRGWFKWGNAPPWQKWQWIPSRVHQLGALFGGGLTCSTLVEGENGLTPAQVQDMATRDANGQTVIFGNKHNFLHGTFSNPAYLDYLFRWCREQIDAGVDYLFMDQNCAAWGELDPHEGFDDYSLADFRLFLLNHFTATQGWAVNDARWQTKFKVAFADPQICPGGDLRAFSYRAYLREGGWLDKALHRKNPLAAAWREFIAWRDDRAWKSLTERIRAYADSKGRRVFISANGLVRYVDLQVLGVWRRWLVKDGQVDLSQSQLDTWRKLVVQGQALAGKRVPVVLFHDWGGKAPPPFPWLAVSPAQRKIWMRIRGAEIYAAGGFFAFPVLGPFGDDSNRDGTLETIAQQTRFYQTYRQLYSRGQFLDIQGLRSPSQNLSLAVWTTDQPRELAVHIINRAASGDEIPARSNVTVELPLAAMPESATAISPDWTGERLAACALADGSLKITLKELEAYAVARLRFHEEIDRSWLKEL